MEKENEKLVLKLEEANKTKKPPSGSPKSVPVDIANQRELQEHLKELNETICKNNFSSKCPNLFIFVFDIPKIDFRYYEGCCIICCRFLLTRIATHLILNFPFLDTFLSLKWLQIPFLGYLRNEKIQLSAFLTSKDAKIRHLHKTALQSEQEKQDLMLQLENMKYNQRSHDQLDNQAIKSMKDRISELELQLEEAQSQAQAYFKGALERNLDATQISKKVQKLFVFF